MENFVDFIIFIYIDNELLIIKIRKLVNNYSKSLYT